MLNPSLKPLLKIVPAIAICALAGLAHSGDITGEQDFTSLLDEHWQRAQQEQVFFRTDADSYRPHGKLAEVSPAARARRQAFNEDILARLERVDQAALAGQDRISYQLFR